MYKRRGWGNAPERKVTTQEWGAKAAREHPTHGTAIGTETNRPEKAIEPALGNPPDTGKTGIHPGHSAVTVPVMMISPNSRVTADLLRPRLKRSQHKGGTKAGSQAGA